MRYSDISVLEVKGDHGLKYRLCRRGEINKKSGKFVGIYGSRVDPLPIHVMFNFAMINHDKVDDLFSEDGDCMLVECKDGDERVILPDELKILLTREYDGIVSDFHRYDEDDGSMDESCLKILNAINSHIKRIA